MAKCMRWTRKKDEDESAYVMSVYDVEQAKVLSQAVVGRKENEITRVPEVLKKVEISRKTTLHPQKRYRLKLSARVATTLSCQGKSTFGCIKIFNNSLCPNIRNPALGKFNGFLTTQKVSKGHGRLETRILTTSEMLNPYSI